MIDRFESQIKRFESLVKKEEMLRATNSNHLFVIRIPHEEHEERLKQGFESFTQRFESLKLEL